MTKDSPVKKSLLNSIAVLVYVSIIAFIMTNAQNIFGSDKKYITPLLVLMLLIVSASVCGFLVFGKPIMLYLDGQKKEAVTLLAYTVAWLAAITIIIMLVLAFI